MAYTIRFLLHHEIRPHLDYFLLAFSVGAGFLLAVTGAGLETYEQVVTCNQVIPPFNQLIQQLENLVVDIRNQSIPDQGSNDIGSNKSYFNGKLLILIGFGLVLGTALIAPVGSMF